MYRFVKKILQFFRVTILGDKRLTFPHFCCYHLVWKSKSIFKRQRFGGLMMFFLYVTIFFKDEHNLLSLVFFFGSVYVFRTLK